MDQELWRASISIHNFKMTINRELFNIRRIQCEPSTTERDELGLCTRFTAYCLSLSDSTYLKNLYNVNVEQVFEKSETSLKCNTVIFPEKCRWILRDVFPCFLIIYFSLIT